MTDCHVHSSFSSDSSTPVEEMIEKAISLGCQRFYITDHMDYDFPKHFGIDFLFSPKDYFEKLAKLKQEFNGKIQIFTGIELGLQPTASVLEQIHHLLEEYTFDLIIGSTHLVNGTDPYIATFWEGRSSKEALSCYFQEILNNLNHFHNFQVLGHLDYAVRYAPSKANDFSYQDHQDVIDEILRFIIREGIALEINTGGYKSGLGRTNPGVDVIKRYLELGGIYLSIGSDAHTPDFYASEFSTVKSMLLSMGVKQYTIFQQGQPCLIPLGI